MHCSVVRTNCGGGAPVDGVDVDGVDSCRSAATASGVTAVAYPLPATTEAPSSPHLPPDADGPVA